MSPKNGPPLTGGKRLRQAIHVARARAEITSDMQLAHLAGISYDTLMNWYSGRTVPRPAEVKKVAEVLEVPYSDLLAAYEGRDPEPQPLADAIRDLVEELRLTRKQQADANAVLLRALTVALAPLSAPSTSERRSPGR